MFLFNKSVRGGILHSRDSLDLDGCRMHDSFLLKSFQDGCKMFQAVIIQLNKYIMAI